MRQCHGLFEEVITVLREFLQITGDGYYFFPHKSNRSIRSWACTLVNQKVAAETYGKSLRFLQARSSCRNDQ